MWQERSDGGITILSRGGPLQGNDAVDRALLELDQRLGGARGRFVVAADAFETLNSEHIATLIRIVRRVSLAGGRMALHRPNPFVRQVLQSLRLARILPIVDDLAEADRVLA